MRRGYLATEPSSDAFSKWSADDSHLSQLVRQNNLHSFVVVNDEFTKNSPKKLDSSSRDSCCLIYGTNFKLSGQGNFFNMTTTPGIKENLIHWRLRVLPVQKSVLLVLARAVPTGPAQTSPKLAFFKHANAEKC